MRYILIILCIGLLFLNFKDTEPKDLIIGTWELVSVYEDSIDVTSNHDPFDERYIRFLESGQFESDGRPFEFNKGDWMLNEDASILEIHSSVENDDSAWYLRIQGDKMEWKGIGNEWKEQFLLCFKRQTEKDFE